MQNKTLTKTPCRVRITKCGRKNWWYADQVGKVFDVNDPGPRMDFVLWEDFCGGGEVWRHIAQEDCVKIEPKK